MAKVVTPLMSFGARGRVAGIINYQRWKGRQYAKQHVDGRDPRTAPQVLSRDTFAVADATWTSSIDLFRDPWNLAAAGRVRSGYNLWQGSYILTNRGLSDLQNLVFSPGAKGGLRTDSLNVLPGDGSLTITFSSPTPPPGWVLESAIAGALLDGLPDAPIVGGVSIAEDAVTQTTVVLTGLTNGAAYVVSGWLRWTKPDGSTAYGPSPVPQLATPVAPPYAADAVRFDGVNDWLTKASALAGAVASRQALISFWFDVQGGDGTDRAILTAAGNDFADILGPGNVIEHRFEDGATTRWRFDTTNTFLAAGDWHHFLLSCDLDGVTNPRKVYIDDVLEVLTGETVNAGDIQWNIGSWAIAAFAAGAFKIEADFADLYMTNEYLDLSIVANRRKFIDAAGKPVSLGADGSTPTGTAPLIFFSGATAAWHTNKGSGAGFTENGALTTAPTSPSD